MSSTRSDSDPHPHPDRRSLLATLVVTGVALITTGLAGLAALVAAPITTRPPRRWRRAVSLFDLPANEPVAAVIAERRDDGWYATRSQRVIFIDRDGDGYRALSSTCQHLGCTVRWDSARTQFLCPCHGGVYDRQGRVVSGPPPRPLERLTVRLNPQTSDLEVEL
jgi:Rieske Fe-S protein